MTRRTAKDFHPETLKLFDDYVHGRLTGRGFLEGVGKFAVAGAAAEGLLLALSPDFAVGQLQQRHHSAI